MGESGSNDVFRRREPVAMNPEAADDIIACAEPPVLPLSDLVDPPGGRVGHDQHLLLGQPRQPLGVEGPEPARVKDGHRDVVAGAEETVLARLVLEHAIEVVVGDVQRAMPVVHRKVFRFHRELLQRPGREEIALALHDEQVPAFPEARHLVHFGIRDEKPLGPGIVGDAHRIGTGGGPHRGEGDSDDRPVSRVCRGSAEQRGGDRKTQDERNQALLDGLHLLFLRGDRLGGGIPLRSLTQT